MKYLMFLFTVLLLGCSHPKKELSPVCVEVSDAIKHFMSEEGYRIDSAITSNSTLKPFTRVQFVVREDVIPCYVEGDMLDNLGFILVKNERGVISGEDVVVNMYVQCDKRAIISTVVTPKMFLVIFEIVGNEEWERARLESDGERAKNIFNHC